MYTPFNISKCPYLYIYVYYMFGELPKYLVIIKIKLEKY